MKKALVPIFAVFLLLAGCAQLLRPIHTETAVFDLDTAKSMIADMEQYVIDLSDRSRITREELDALTAGMEAVYGEHARDVAATFFDVAEMEDDTVSELSLLPQNCYPTIYHQGVEITDAYTASNEYDDPFFNETYLHVREDYTGDDPLFKDFYREYVFKADENKKWVFSGFGGTVNYQGDEYTGALALK